MAAIAGDAFDIAGLIGFHDHAAAHEAQAAGGPHFRHCFRPASPSLLPEVRDGSRGRQFDPQGASAALTTVKSKATAAAMATRRRSKTRRLRRRSPRLPAPQVLVEARHDLDEIAGL